MGVGGRSRMVLVNAAVQCALAGCYLRAPWFRTAWQQDRRPGECKGCVFGTRAGWLARPGAEKPGSTPQGCASVAARTLAERWAFHETRPERHSAWGAGPPCAFEPESRRRALGIPRSGFGVRSAQPARVVLELTTVLVRLADLLPGSDMSSRPTGLSSPPLPTAHLHRDASRGCNRRRPGPALPASRKSGSSAQLPTLAPGLALF